MPETLPEEKRREIFRTLVSAQDAGDSVAESRSNVAIQFRIELDEVRSIEREGITNQWAPL